MGNDQFSLSAVGSSVLGQAPRELTCFFPFIDRGSDFLSHKFFNAISDLFVRIVEVANVIFHYVISCLYIYMLGF
jgi:hypothetical protein